MNASVNLIICLVYTADVPGAQVLKGHDLKAVGSHKQILSCVQREPRLTGVNKLDDSLHDRRRHFLQSDLSEAGLNQGAGEHGPKVRAHGRQEDSEGWKMDDNGLCGVHAISTFPVLSFVCFPF